MNSIQHFGYPLCPHPRQHILSLACILCLHPCPVIEERILIFPWLLNNSIFLKVSTNWDKYVSGPCVLCTLMLCYAGHLNMQDSRRLPLGIHLCDNHFIYSKVLSKRELVTRGHLRMWSHCTKLNDIFNFQCFINNICVDSWPCKRWFLSELYVDFISHAG